MPTTGEDCVAGEPTANAHRQSLIEIVVNSWQWKLFFGLLALAAGLVGIKGNVSSDVRNVLTGVVVLAILVLGWLLYRNLYQWNENNTYYRRIAYHSTAALLGVGYERLEMIGYLKSDGAMVIERKAQIKAFATGIQKIDLYMFAREAPEGGEISAEVVGGTATPVGKRSVPVLTAELTYTKRSHDVYFGVLKFSAPLERGETYEFHLRESLLEKSFALSRSDMKADQSCEFLAYDVTRPVRHLNMKVQFFDYASFMNPKHDVWMGQTRMTLPREYEQTARSWKVPPAGQSPQVLELDVPGPVQGLSYVISWVPPTAVR
jgi:hypothetical protein